MKRIFDWLTGLIPPFAAAEGPPPQTTGAFLRWALAGSERGIAVTIVAVILSGISEMAVGVFTGWLIDAAAAAGPGAFWGPYTWWIVGGAVFFLVLRPLIAASDAFSTSIVLQPYLFPLVLSRVNRHVLGQSMRYFDNDFAGRISQKAMQISRALTDIVVEVCDIVIYGATMFIVAMLLVGGVDLRLLGIFALWGVAYYATLRWFIPRVRVRSAARAGARTLVTGQIVDTLSNMTTVKLFAHDDYEDRAALDALDGFRDKALRFGVISGSFRLVLVALGRAAAVSVDRGGAMAVDAGAGEYRRHRHDRHGGDAPQPDHQPHRLHCDQHLRQHW